MSTEEPNLRRVRRTATMGDPDSAAFNMFYGPSHYGSSDLVPINQDVLGYVFITKPNCNMRRDNISHIRKLQYLTDDDPNSMASAIKCSLSTYHGWDPARHGTRSNVINDLYPFIPFLSSSLESVSGWPDEAMEFFESEEGWAKQTFGWADGRPESFSSFDLQWTFNSKEGDPHSAFFTAIHQYMGHVALGNIGPLEYMETEFEIDYQSNVYIIIMDRAKKFVQKIACLGGGGMWMGTNNGAAFNVQNGPTLQLDTRQISVPMRCHGFMYNDPAIIERFNKLAGDFNPSMRKVIYGQTDHNMVRIPQARKHLFQNRGYPLINPSTSELEWWIEQSVHDDILTTTQGAQDEQS